MQQLWINELVGWYKDNGMEQEAVSYLEQRYDKPSQEILFPMYVSSGLYSEAQQVLNNHCSQWDDESVAYCQLNTIVLSWAENGLTAYEMSVDDSTTIASIAAGSTQCAAQAQSLIRMVYNEEI